MHFNFFFVAQSFSEFYFEIIYNTIQCSIWIGEQFFLLKMSN
jgi:hypothetical protein